VSGGDASRALVFADENIWLTETMLEVLYHVNVRTLNEHLKESVPTAHRPDKTSLHRGSSNITTFRVRSEP
jgi:hypothetical protein